ncbi:Proton-dependent Oligopeptide Transporter (POT) Family [Thraustotheca clavata]|uniref:Proton-dependent Oligopeptide Transporter (POT) Family n=1 Tax=Thraustotheca clavata TaxID=74557 RepID=A0A1W0A765_9STRA|nr:Proton-dependent Oligopeptide Transporter (POT) Family [Thraustotheca clavata]
MADLGTPNVGNYASVWDARPRQFKNVLFQVCGFILLMEVSERLSYYGINQGLKNFMRTVIGWSSVSSNSIKSTWTSLCYLSPLLGAYLADERWGRFKTIATFGILYLIGDIIITIAANPHVLNWKETSVAGEFDRSNADTGTAEGLFIFGLFACIGVGTGAIKSNVITIGADQFNPNDPKEVAQKVTFFSYFYWCVNFGSVFSYGYLATLSVEGGGSISKDYGYFATFLICSCVMAVALFFFFLGHSRYILFPPNSDAMSKLVRVLGRSAWNSESGFTACSGFIFLILSFILNFAAVFMKDGSDARKGTTYAAGFMALFGCIQWVYSGYNYLSMDRAKHSQGGRVDDQSIDEIKSVVRVLPFAAFTVMWQCVYDQIDANFQSIAQQTDLRFGDSRDASQLSGAVLGVFDPIAIVICVPFLDSIVYPFYQKKFGKPASPFGKVLVGLAISTATMFYVGGFEVMRKNSGLIMLPNATHPKEMAGVKNEAGGELMNQLQWGWNIPQYVLVALCECLINVTAFDVFYSEVPMYLKSTCQAINLFMISMGSNVTSIFTLIFQKNIPNDLNEGNLEYMFYAVGVASAINLCCYTVIMLKMQFGMMKIADNLHQDDDLKDKDALIDRTSNQMDSRQSFTQQRA